MNFCRGEVPAAFGAGNTRIAVKEGSPGLGAARDSGAGGGAEGEARSGQRL